MENMNVLQAPRLDDPADRVLVAFDDRAVVAVTHLAGALALVAYCVFAVAFLRLCRSREPSTRPWTAAGLAGAVGGVLLALVALAATVPLAAGYGAGLPDDVVRALYRAQLSARQLAGAPTGLFLLCASLAARGSRVLPAPVAWCGTAIGALLTLSPLALLVQETWAWWAVLVVFALHAAWIFVASLWVLLAADGPFSDFVRRAAFFVLVVAAGLVGAALVAVPAAAGDFFSWGLKPVPLAAFAGGAYLASAAVYAAALDRPAHQTRALVAGAAVLSVSVLTITLLHIGQFDLGRLQAIAWIFLFALFSVVTVVLAVTDRTGGTTREPTGPLVPWVRVLLLLLVAALGALAVALWADPRLLAAAAPFPLPPLGGRFAGSWVALLAVLLGWATLRNRRDEARLPVLALIALPCGALLAGLRTLADLPSYETALAYFGVLLLLASTGVGVLVSLRPESTR
ncbi:hypothetical protein [Streptosporangium sp. OZ121]|uniref:hypothetical protein n=1 Tax=Streptosporangium sp. OZ121 TaxID=3444183 RepID=UPI003F7AF10D